MPDGLRLLCEYPELTLNPNGVIDLRVVVQLPLDLPAGATNCVEGVCIPIITGTPLPPPPPLTPGKLQVETFCTPGDLCNFEITLTNNTGAVWSGSPRVTDQLPPGATPLGASAPWACAPNGAQVTCEYPPVTLNPGEAVTVVITVQLPLIFLPEASIARRSLHPDQHHSPSSASSASFATTDACQGAG